MQETTDEQFDGAIAVIGMSGRFPGAGSVAQFWGNLLAGVESIARFSDEELLASGIPADLLRRPDYVKARGVLDDVDRFDADFFGFRPKDAQITDPQHRVFLECAWEALEAGGYDPRRTELLVGVFAGSSMNTYMLANMAADRAYIEDLVNGYQVGNYATVLGNDKDYLASRVSYKLNLKGPAIAMQTACSTSLVAVAQAVQSLLCLQCDMALAGGVSITFPQQRGTLYQEDGMTSLDGHCRAFDANSSGTVFGGGAGVVLLKRYEDALADGDAIHAVIRGAAVNNDGSDKASYLAPSSTGQAEVIAMAQAIAGIDANTIGFVETHGTGTPLGDPIEIAGLVEAFRATTDAVNYCALGSVKTNIGHLEAAAGVTGLIKAVLAVKYGRIPGTLHYESPNPRLALDGSPFFVSSQAIDWPIADMPRRAGVSSFGVGGTNAHVVVESAPDPEPASPSRTHQLLLLSAKTESALDAAAHNLAAHLAADDTAVTPEALADIAYTLQVGRSEFAHRRALVCATANDAIAALNGDVKDRAVASVAIQPVSAPAFLFPGQGAQHANMGRSLYDHETCCRRVVDDCAEMLHPILGLDLREILYPVAGGEQTAQAKLTETWLTQPALFVTEYALAMQWREWGIHPSAMIGHSIGEFVAATLAGVFSLPDALRVVAGRGRLMQDLPSGAMLSIRAPLARVDKYITGSLALAAVNSESLCVASGPHDEIDSLAKRLEEASVVCRKLQTSHAFHSSMMDPILGEFEALVGSVALNPPAIPYVSNVSATWITDNEATDPAYYARHLRGTVRFADGLATLLEDRSRPLLEVGPGVTLSTLARRHGICGDQRTVIATLGHPSSELTATEHVLEAVGRLWLAGTSIDWAAFYLKESRRRVPLPTYPFERQRYWVEPPSATQASAVTPSASRPEVEPQSNPTERAEMYTSSENPAPNAPTTAAPAQSTVSRADALLEMLTGMTHDLSGIARERLDENASFLDLGLDSLFLTQATQVFAAQFGVPIKFRHLLDECSTLRKLADHIDARLPDDAFQPAPPPAAPVAAAPPASAPISLPPSAPQTGRVVMPGPGSGSESLVERVIREQLAVMARQLEMLSEAPPGASTGVLSMPAPANASAPSLPAPPSVQTTPTSVVSAPRIAEPPTKAFGPYKPIEKGESGGLTPMQQDALDELIERYVSRTPTSKKMTESARTSLADPRVVAGFKSIWKEMVYPIVASRSSGSRIYDVDSNEYVDVTMGFGLNLLGHSPQFITHAVLDQLEHGVEIGPQSPLAGEVAKMICEMTGKERVTFCNTGSEAVMAALRIARTVTGRSKIVYFSGDYHGTFDEVLGRPSPLEPGKTVPAAPGIPAGMLGEVVLLEYGTQASLDYIAGVACDLAAVLVEPVQSRKPYLQPAEFLRAVRKMTEQAGTALIFDEVITGFRCHPGGAQALFGIDADIATYGKIIGGGMPIGVVAGSARFMDAFDGGAWQYGDDSFPEVGVTFFAGTFVRHPLALAACRAMLTHLKEQGGRLQQNLNETTTLMTERINANFEAAGVPLRINHFASLFYLSYDRDIKYGSLIYYYLRAKGIHIWEGRPCFLSTAHSEVDIDAIVEAFDETVVSMQDGGFLPGPPDGPIRRPEPPKAGRLSLNGLDAVLFPAEAELNEHRNEVADAGRASGLSISVPMTAAQRELWITSQMSEGASCALNESITLRMRGTFDPDAMRRSIAQLIDRHEALRTTFSPDGEFQRTSSSIECDVPLFDLSILEGDERRARAGQLMSEEGRIPFDLAIGPLIRAKIISLATDYHLTVITAHHIICDGWSMGILLEELAAIYTAQVTGKPPVLAEPKRFSELACEQMTEPFVAQAREAQRYWLERLDGLESAMELPTDRPRRNSHRFEGSRAVVVMPATLVERVRRLGTDQSSTLYTTLLAGFTAYLHRLTGQSGLLVGVPSAGQAHNGFSRVVGHCVSLLPLRADVDSETPFAEHIGAIKSVVNDSQDHPECTIGSLASETLAGRDSLSTPLISATFNLEKQMSDLEFGPLSVEVDVNPRSFAQFEMGLNLVDIGGAIRIECDYRSDLFDEVTIKSWLTHFVHLLDSATADPTIPVGKLSLIGAAESEVILGEWAGETTEYGRDRSISSFFDEQVKARPNAVAVQFGDHVLSYRELNERAERVAALLADNGVAVESRVGVCIDRSLESIVGLVGIVKAGAAYVPIDPAYPDERIAYMVADAGVRFVATTQVHSTRLAALGLECVQVDGALRRPRRSTTPRVEPTGESLAYVMYTSGSTGEPKGVCVTQRGVTRLVKWTNYVHLGADETILQLAPLTFDASTFEVWGSLLCGGKLALMPPGQSSLREIGQALKKARVTTLWLTAGLFHSMVDHELASLSGVRQLLAGGDVLSPSHVRTVLEALPGCRLINGYGPTENTTFTCCHSITEADAAGDSIPIGRPIPNTTVYILDRAMQPAPIGMAGSLYAGGDGIARGYAKSESVTDSKFVKNPFGGATGSRLYATGDRARWRKDGVIEFLGRSDAQVKVRGFRVEPAEIELNIAAHPGVAQALVHVLDRGCDDKRLIAYYTAEGTTAVDPADLRKWIAQRLPAYMTPSEFIKLDAIPLTRNGKADRKALPMPGEARDVGVDPPLQDEIEIDLVEIWRGLLGVKKIGVDDDFFALGGHSLLAIRLCAQVETRFHARITVSTLLEGPSVRSLAAVIRRSISPATLAAAPAQCLTPIRAGGSRPPLFCVHHIDGVAVCYKELATFLPADQPVIGIESRSVNAEITPLRRVEDIATEYLADIKKAQPAGPYLLCGLSFGGVVAFEIARLLKLEGRNVGFLGLIDTYGPDYFRSAVANDKERPIVMRAIEQIQTFGALEGNGKIGFVKTKARSAMKRLRQAMPGGGDLGVAAMDGFVAERIRTVKEANEQALRDYYPQTYDGRITLFRAKERLDRNYNDPLLSWGGLATDGIVIREVLGNHYTVVQNPFAKELAREIESCLSEVLKDVDSH